MISGKPEQQTGAVMNLQISFKTIALTGALLLAPAFAMGGQPAAPQDNQALLATVTKAMGLEGVNSLYFYGTGANASLGQNNNADIPWPRTPLNDVTRAIDFSQNAMRTTFSTYAVPVIGGAATLVPVQQMVNANSPGGWNQQLELWTTPWGFVKGAAANGFTVQSHVMNGQRHRMITWSPPIKSPGGQSYRVVGQINNANLVERVQTWVEHGIYGDMLVDTEYKFYRDNNGLKYPTEISQKRGGWPVFEMQVLGAFANSSKIAQLMTPNPPPAGAGPPAGPPPGGPPPTTSEKLADGVYRIKGAYNSMAVEFADHVILFEPGPQNEARALAGVAETKRLFPNKPIRYGVVSHHHFDHTGGIAGAVAEGVTIFTHDVNKNFLEKALSGPRTLAPDAMAKSGRKLKIETFKGEKHVFQDATRTLELHVVRGLPHVDGNIIAWLPKEKLLAYSDMFNFPPASDPVPNPQVVGTRVFYENIQRLGLDPVGILSIHTMNPDRLATMQDIKSSLGY